MIPHVTNHDDADITELEAFRVQLNKENEKSGVKVTMLAFLIKACVAALKKFPEFNASLDGEQLVLKQYFHIGFAADTPNGLVVPVLKDADKKGVLQISQEMSELASEGARRQAVAGRNERRLLLDQLAGRHRRHLLHADHQRARGCDPRRVPQRDAAGVGRQGSSRRVWSCHCRCRGTTASSTAPRQRASTPILRRSSPISGACCYEAPDTFGVGPRGASPARGGPARATMSRQ